MQRGAPLVAASLALVGVAALGAHVSPGFAASAPPGPAGPAGPARLPRLATPAELAPRDHFTFLVYGDNRDRDEDHRRVVQAMLGGPADLLIHTGDMTGDGGDDGLWRRFLDIEAPLLATAPLYAALGNHEFLHDPTAAHFHHYIPLPDGAEPKSDPRWYRFRFGNALFIALDGTHSRDHAQHDFLERALVEADRDPSIRHKFVFFHQPPFAAGDMCGSAAEQGLWVPEFAHHGVRAVFTGHDHAYERLERDGIRYFVSGGGGAPLHHESAHCPRYDREALRKFVATHHFLRVRVNGSEVTLDAIATSGEVIDHVRLDAPAEKGPTPPPVPFQDPSPHGPQMIDARMNPRLSDGVRADQFPIPSAAPRGSIAALVAFFGIVMMVGIGLVVIVRKLK